MSRGIARVGCSGWMYDGWADDFYRGLRRRDWFGRYRDRFGTVELNATFYRLPDASTVQGWAEAAPDGFVFSVKLGQFVSHRKKLREPELWLANHFDRVELLGEHLGPTLVQLPGHWRVNAARLDEFLDAWPAAHRVAVELRDPSWLCDDVLDVLSGHGAALCIHDLVASHPMVLTADWTYLRFHGPHAIDAPYHGRYGARRLAPMADALAAWCDEGIDVYAYFNNDVGGNAVRDATWLQDHVRAVRFRITSDRG